MGAGDEATPVVSILTTDTDVLSANLGFGVHVKLPLPATGTESHPGTGAPFTVALTISPGSAVPVMRVPLVGLTNGVGGTVRTLKGMVTSPVVSPVRTTI